MLRSKATHAMKAAGIALLGLACLLLAAASAARFPGYGDFMPHGYCYLWDPLVLWLNVISDSLITLSYYCIPAVLIYFVRKNRELPFNRIFFMFGVFILACGTTHLMEVWNIWHANYLFAGTLKAVTAIASVVTTLMLVPLVPKVISLPGRMQLEETNRKLEQEIAQRARFDAPVENLFRRRMNSGFAVAVLLTVFTGVWAWRGALRAEQDAFWVSHTHEVMETIQRVSRNLTEAVTSARSFSLTGEEPLLMQYQTARGTIFPDESGLRHLTADNLSQQRRLDALEPQLRATLEFADGLITKRGQSPAHSGSGDALESERLLDAVRASTKDMYEEETRLLAQRTERAQAGQRLTRVIAFTGAFLVVGLCGFARFVVNHEINVSSRARRQINILNAELEQRVAQRTAQLETINASLQKEILARAEAERELRESQDRLRGIIASAMDAIVTVDAQQKILLFNSAAEKMFRCQAAEAIGQSVEQFIPERFRGKHAKHIRSFGETGTTSRSMGILGAIWGVRKDGEEFPIEASISQVKSGGKQLFTVILRDISERQSQEAHRLRLAAIVDSSEDAILSKDLAGRIVTWNRGAEKLYGYAAQEMIGRPATTIIPPAFHEEERQLLSEVAAGRRAHRDETTRVCKNGSLIQVAVTVSPVRDGHGQIIGASSISHDIGERRRMEDALRESQQRMANILDSAMDAIVTIDDKYRVVLFNAAAEKMFGCFAGEAIGSSIDRFIPERFRRVHGSHIRNFGETGSTKRTMGTLGAVWGLRKNGKEFPVEASISQVEVGGKKLFTVILRDITDRRRSEERLREQGRVLDISNMLVREMDGRITLWTKGAEQLYGYSSEEAVGRVSHELFQTKFPESLSQLDAALLESGRWEGELEHRKKDGRTVFVASVQTVYRDEQGRAIHILEANTDITSRKQGEQRLADQAEELSRQAHDLMLAQDSLREQSRIFQLVLDSMGEGLVAADQNGAFLLWNRAAEKILGHGPAAIPPGEWSAHYGAYLTDGVTLLPLDQNPLARAMAGGECETELVMRPPDSGKTIWIEVTAHPLRDESGASRGGVAVLRDTTQRKSDEREIRRLNEDLERRVLARTAQLEAANKELEAFTYSVSHDLRAPLRHMSGFSKILTEDFGASLPAEAQQHLQRIQEGTRRMGALVDDLLSLGRIGRQEVRLQVSGLGSIVQEVVAELRRDCEGRPVEWKVGQLPFVECDPGLVRQVFQNLLANAVKFTRPRSPAIIEVGQREQDGANVIYVRDNGVGFSMKYADKLFGVFQRLHRQEDFEGTGVGLATIQRIIQKHGGRIWAEAELDKGATFYFTLGNSEANQGSANSASKGANA